MRETTDALRGTPAAAELTRPVGGSAHPLLGADPGTLWALLRRHGARRGDRLGVLVGAVAASVARAPLSAIEYALTERRRARAGFDPPVFILGHWRSGTTHLYNLLSRSEDFGFVPPLATGLPWDCVVLGRALRPLLSRLLPRERFIDSLPVHPDSPQEDEAAMANMQPASFYHGLYFPRRLREEVMRGIFFDGVSERETRLWERRFAHFIAKVALMQRGRRLFIKNPVYTARPASMRRFFPGAAFIHIHRDPRAVFSSMRRFYRKLLEVYAVQPFDPGLIDGLILEVYERMMDRFTEEISVLGEDAFVEVAYDDLVEDPIGSLRFIGVRLGLSRQMERAEPRFREYLETVRGHRTARHELTDEDSALVESRWGRFIRRWGYDRPRSQARRRSA